MKTNRFLLAACVSFALAFTISCSSDDGDGTGGGDSCNIQDYKTVTIGTQTWMAENSNCNVSGSVCYGNDPANCAKYGRLYNWETAKTVCPSGWHLPSNEEWTTLTDYVESQGDCNYYCAGTRLKAQSGWNDDGNGTNNHGFSALPGGLGYSDGSFYDVGDYGFWWSASEYDSSNAYYRGMGNGSEIIDWGDPGKTNLFSVRCIQD